MQLTATSATSSSSRSNGPGRLGGSHRFRVSATLASRPFETFLLDVGLGAEDTLATEILRTDDLLGFAGIEPVEVAAVPLELQVAEKFHAYTRSYEGQRPSTRVKDLVDLGLIAELSSLDAATLHREVATVFTLRETHSPPATLPPPPPEWETPFRRLAKEVGASETLEAGHRDAAALLDPVLSGEVTTGTWNKDERRWVADEATTERNT
jgi:hypothetical protein